MLIYVVKSGDSLWKISNYFNVPPSKIIIVNGLEYPNNLLIGQSLLIPTEDILYTVKAGESLWQIARTLGTSVQTIARANPRININNIYPGLQLYIPATRYQVKYEESLQEIAERYGVPLESLMDANNIKNPSLVYPGTILIIPLRRPVTYVNGYIYDITEESVPVVRESGPYLTYLSPFAYKIKEDGSLEPLNDSQVISAAYAEKIAPMMAVTNFTSTELGNNLAHAVLSSAEISEKLINNILNVMKEKGYLGVNIDFENVLPEDRENYNRFLELTVEKLHAENYFVSTALAPKTGETQQGLLYEAHDYKAHGRIVDFVILMTYEWGYRLGPPQAVSPLNQIKKVLDYAVTVIPRDKIFFGFQLYARDWVIPHVQGMEAETFSMQEAIARAVKHGAIIHFDPISQTPFYRYTDNQGKRHEVWFEDARSAQAKFDTVKDYKLKGISYWALGFPFPQNWVLLKDNFNIKKII
ncbi:LysM peptidoglycan-binding domain-containing protein [Clostridium amazonitimonense]|uniref:LysM peptidoglycan-binding domain-containing protein n=1 Tax=Clostridium amazonitimonense TaxID=1499689 RepID=UPI0005095C05|nr:LysM peptidoglycan-binding domain-containing protein [Clostridium amazonitimonense]